MVPTGWISRARANRNSHVNQRGKRSDGSKIALQPRGSAIEVFLVFLKLGLTSFDGPVAHLPCCFYLLSCWCCSRYWPLSPSLPLLQRFQSFAKGVHWYSVVDMSSCRFFIRTLYQTGGSATSRSSQDAQRPKRYRGAVCLCSLHVVVMFPAMGGWLGGLNPLIAIFAPVLMLVIGTLPFWELLCQRDGVQRTMVGVNAAVVGVLGAALYDPVWTSAIHSGAVFGLALAAFGLLVFGRLTPILFVVLAAITGWLRAF